MAQFSVTFPHGVEDFDGDARYDLHAGGALVIDDGEGRRTTYSAGQWLKIGEETPQTYAFGI